MTRNNPADNSELQRLPPHSNEAEQGVLGCILTDPNTALSMCIEKLRDSGAGVFYDLRHQTIYKATQELFESGTGLDLITLQQHLKDRNQLEQVGGLMYLGTLQTVIPSVANIGYYLEILLEKWKLRKAVVIATEIVVKAYGFEGDADAFLDKAESDILSVRAYATTTGVRSMKESVLRVQGTIDEWGKRKGKVMGYATGFHELDEMTGGLAAPDMWVIGGRPSQGKTSIAMNMVEHLAIDQKIPVGVFSMEMSQDALTMRMMCSRARVNIKDLRKGKATQKDFDNMATTGGKIALAPIYVEDLAGITIMELRARARRMVQQFGIKVFVVDYLQLLTATIHGRRLENRAREMAECSAGCKNICKELGIPGIVISQLNRELDKEGKRKPRLSDLKETGSIEQDADIVGLLYQDEEEKKDEDEKPKKGKKKEPAPPPEESPEPPPRKSFYVPMRLVLGKNRNGDTGEVALTFIKSFTRFESATELPQETFVQANMEKDLLI